MTAARLEELAEWAENEQREQRFDGSFQRDQNYADLARCARGWAKVERDENPNLERWDWPQGARWYFRSTCTRTGTGQTAIEAVEAAEVKL